MRLGASLRNPSASEVAILMFLSGFGRLPGSRINQKSIPEGIEKKMQGILNLG